MSEPVTLKCPECGQAIPAEEYFAHYDSHFDKTEAAKKATAQVMTARLLMPYHEMLEEKARSLGFSSIEEYQKHKDDVFAKENTFEGVIVAPIEQDMILGLFERAVAEPEIMPKGMVDPVDYALSDFLPMIYRDGTAEFVGYASRRVQESSFPTGKYEVDYRVARVVIQANGWVLGAGGWKKA